MQKLANLARAVMAEAAIYGPAGALRRSWLWYRKWQYRRRNSKWQSPPQPAVLPVVSTPRIAKPAQLSVLFVAGTTELLSRRYRVDNIREQLAKQGFQTRIVEDLDARRLKRQLRDFDVIVFQRTIATAELLDFTHHAQASRCAVAFEIDDYLFDEDLYETTDMFRTLPEVESRALRGYMLGYREMLLACPNFVGTTRFLADKAARLHRQSYVIRNGLSDEYLSLARKGMEQKRQVDSGRTMIRIGYLSGTKTHSDDFKLIVGPLRRLMAHSPEVCLCLFGHLELPSELLPFKDRITVHSFMRWEKLVAHTASLDLVVAPLQETAFNQAKSALKYFEAAALEVPTVASPTEDFQVAITHGVNGLLAASDDEWFTCLHDLVSNAEWRRRIGQAARRDVLQRYTSDAQSVHTRDVMLELARQAH